MTAGHQKEQAMVRSWECLVPPQKEGRLNMGLTKRAYMRKPPSIPAAWGAGSFQVGEHAGHLGGGASTGPTLPMSPSACRLGPLSHPFLVNQYRKRVFLSSVMPSTKLSDLRRGPWEPDLWPVRSTGDNLNCNWLLKGAGAVLWGRALNLRDLTPSPGRQCQNERVDHPAGAENCCRGSSPHIW